MRSESWFVLLPVLFQRLKQCWAEAVGTREHLQAERLIALYMSQLSLQRDSHRRRVIMEDA